MVVSIKDEFTIGHLEQRSVSVALLSVESIHFMVMMMSTWSARINIREELNENVR